MITPKNIVKHELIGLDVEIVGSSDRTQIGLKGRIVDETRNTFAIDCGRKEKAVIKENCAFLFKLPSKKSVKVEGKILVGRPEDRIKKKFEKW